jgi:hypothetical protein
MTTMPATLRVSSFLTQEKFNVITFKSHSDLRKLPRDDPARPVMQELVRVLIDDFTEPGQSYDADDYGYLVLIEPGDVGRVLTDVDMPWTLADVPWEGASMRDGFYYAVYLGTDDYGMGFVIPDAPWVDGRLREVLESILDHPDQSTLTPTQGDSS